MVNLVLRCGKPSSSLYGRVSHHAGLSATRSRVMIERGRDRDVDILTRVELARTYDMDSLQGVTGDVLKVNVPCRDESLNGCASSVGYVDGVRT